ncbi:ESX-1 secretion system protein EccCa1 [Corynebacterium occultum]|uniref:ESX-1 secretion system protein EccCa1 n=1 Tax=Corynebacterium occultum TaxID=2675219 RepID=A0A6B8VTQ8_9CORY|nr:type VII secretion protein EccCa [Corynebacterium occultum]QGU06469.1 ESX-1 secretion system protein EccCa1 [Corynebacterium occultum]
MLAVAENHVVEPLSTTEREPAPPLPSGQLNAESVPAASRPGPTPLLRILMPVVMISAMIALVAMMFLNSGDGPISPMMLVFPLMMAMGFLMMFAPPQGEDTDETRRTFLRHLALLREKALAHAAAQRAHEFHRHPDPARLLQLCGSRRMWERGTGDPDVLEVRIGTGTTTLCTPVVVPDSGATEDLDPVCAVSLRHTVAAVGTVPGMPVVVALQAFRFLSLSGPGAEALGRAILAQLVFHHGPETVGVQVLGSGWEWGKWLPHTRNPEVAAHRVLFVVDQPTTGVEEFIEDGFWSVIIDISPGGNTALAERAEQEGLALSADPELVVHTAGGPEILGIPEQMGTEQAVLLARSLSAYRRPAGTQGTSSGDLLSLLGYRDITELTPDTMWAPRGARRLAVPVGLSDNGTPLLIDLKESAHGGMGPHGLCIGATGSGKSELLRTLVLSLIATHSPDDLNLVLVDFKGGATFLGLESLPHTSALITNLEEEAVLVERMQQAISGEMNRRQEQLRQAGNFANVSDYTAARQDRPELPPLPALFIVVDEFSELLGQHPDFAELFAAVGRLGRSLQVHLLLASQRLEEGRLRGLDSHLSYRIGLKTFSAAESRQVLGVVDAHHLPASPGAGFLKSDAETLTAFQASYVSGPLPRRVSTELPAGHQVRAFNSWEDIDTPTEEVDTILDESLSLLDAVVDVATEAGEKRGQQAHRIWLPPLPPVVELAGVAEKQRDLAVAVGIIDRPYQQRQDPYVLDLSGAGGHAAICGGPQSGKSNGLRTIVAALAATHSTTRIRFYILDLGARELATLARLPHVAGVAGRGDTEKINRIIDEVSGFVAEPEEYHTFLVIDGWHSLATEHEELVERIGAIAADGLSARVHLLLSVPRWTVLRPSIRDLIHHRIELRLGEAMDSLIDRKAQQKLPAAPGRGLTADAEHMLLALTANQDIAHITTTAEQAGESPVPALKMLPANIAVGDLALSDDPGIPFAVGGPRLATLCWDPGHHPHLICLGSQGSGKSGLIRTLGLGIAHLGRESARLVIIDHRRTHLGVFPEDLVAAYSAAAASTAVVVADLVATLRSRLPGPEITAAELASRSWWSGPELYLLIDDFDLIPEGSLQELVELLPHARDIGLHVVLARKAGGMGRALFAPFLSTLKDQQPAVLLLDADREEGAVLGIRPSPQPPGRGIWQLRGSEVGICQVARSEMETGASAGSANSGGSDNEGEQ